MKHLFLLLPAVFYLQLSNAQNVKRLEYFFNTDKGVGLNTVIQANISQDGSFSFNPDFSGIPAGSQIFFTRIQDDNGNWSQTMRNRIQVQPANSEPVNLQLEYFYDEDPGFGAGRKLLYTPASVANTLPFTAATNELTPGVHSLYVRSLDSYGRWSQTSRRVIEVLPSEQVRQIVSGEYFFDLDPGIGAGRRLEITNKDSVISQPFSLSVAGISPGIHAMFIRYLDNNGNWGHTTRRTIEISPAPDTNRIVTLEYAVNTDPGFGAGKKIQLPVPLQNGEFKFTIPVQDLKPGFDTIYLRVKDQSDIYWSHTQFARALVTSEIIFPLTLLSFSGIRIDREVNLRWKTANEVNTSGFAIERSLNGTDFKEVGRVPARTMTTAADYFYADDVSQVYSGRLFYRLRQIDNDGSFTYSRIINVEGMGTTNGFMLSPNPAASFVDLRISGPLVPSTVTVSDFSGRKLLTKNPGLTNSFRLDVSSLPSGIYNLTITNQFGNFTQRLVKR